MFQMIASRPDGSTTIQVFETEKEATAYPEAVVQESIEYPELEFGIGYVMWVVVTDLTDGSMVGMWKLTDNGFYRMYTNHIL